MGQLIGRAAIVPEAEPYSNLSRRSIANIWQSFNDIADGFGIGKDEFEEICGDLKDEWNVSRVAVAAKASALFLVLDTDKNGLIDALEFSSTVAALSGMRLREVLEFMLTTYDFDGSQQLSIDEVTLALKSLSTGLCKVSGNIPPREELIELLVSAMYYDITGSETTDLLRLRISVLAEHLNSHPDIRSWFAYFGNPHQTGLKLHEVLETEKDYDCENVIVARDEKQTMAVDWNLRGKHFPPASEPWLQSVSMLTPMEYSSKTMRKLPPDASLGVEWVFGYQSERSRNNVKYNFRGDVVYHVGKYAITYSFMDHQQSIFMGHNEEIACLAIHPELQIVATGDVGPKPRLLVWHSVTREILFTDRSFHRNGVIHTAFSHDGKLLAAIGNDAYHTLSVYHWEQNTTVFTALVNQGSCHGVCFRLDGAVAVGGDSYLFMWSKGPEGFIKQRGNFSSHSEVEPVTCLVAVEGTGADSLVTGTVSGQLFLWVDRNCLKIVKAHQGCVNSLYCCPHGLISAGKDNRIRLWTQTLEPGATFDMSNFGYRPSMRSICMSNDGKSMILGTKGANIYEISAIDGSDLRGGPVVSGHCTGKLRYVATNPSKNEFVTVGDDRRLRVWDMQTKSVLKIATFDAEIRAVCFSALGDMIAVGLGELGMKKSEADNAGANDKVGAYIVISEQDLTVIHEARDSQKPITCIVFSPECDTLAVGSEDCAVYLYSVVDDYELIGRCVRHTAPITHVDFSLDGEWIRSNSANHDICFWSADDASAQTNLPSMRDVKWASFTCIYNWHVKAAHKSVYPGEEVLALHTPPSNPDFLACCTNYGYIRLHSFPCVPYEESEYHRYPAHANEVACIRFSYDASKLISIGLQDRAIVLWKSSHYPVEGGDTKPDLDLPESEDFALEAREGSDLGDDFMDEDCDATSAMLNALDVVTSSAFPASPAVDVWLESVVPPTNPPVQHKEVPDMSLRLEYAYGYTCQEMRNNVRYTSTGDIVYPCATLGVVLNKATRAQNFFHHHTDAITAFACSFDGRFVASGQLGHNPFLCVWSTATCEVESCISDVHLYGISALSFSHSDRLLAALSLDEDHTISVYDWRNDVLISRFYGGSKRIMDLCFSEDDNNLSVCGVKQIKTWSNVQNRTPTSVRPTIGEEGVLQTFLTCRYFAGSLVVGTQDGSLYIFDGTYLRQILKVHNGPVNAMDVNARGTNLVTGGRDGAVRIWNETFENIKEFTVDNLISSQCPRVRSVAFSSDNRHIVVSTRGAEVFEVSIRDAAQAGGKLLVNGHGTRELWGLATHPTKDEFATCGDDCTIRIWDAKSFTVTKCLKVDVGARAIAYSKDGRYLAIGFGVTIAKKVKGKTAQKEGSFSVLNASDFKIEHEGKDSNEPIRVVKFNPASTYLAVAAEDSHIYLYSIKEGFARFCTVTCHKAPLVSIDFTMDGMYMMSVDTTHRICFSEAITGMQIGSPATLRDQKWATWTTPVGWPAQGLWMCQPAGVVPTTAARSYGGMLLASGNSAGRLYITHNPCQTRPGFISVLGHAGPICNVSWAAGDSTIYTIGSRDHTVLQWKCVYDGAKESGDEGGLSCDDSEVDRDGGHEYPKGVIARKKEFLSAGDKTSGGTNPPESPQWTSMICPPSVPKDDEPSVPEDVFELNFVHGVRIADCRQVLRYNEDGNTVFIAVSLGIIYDREEQKERIYAGHKNQLISLDVDRSGKYAATGEFAASPELHIWDARTAKHILTMRNIHRSGISSISFSSSGEYLASLGQDAHHSVVVMRSPSKRWADGYVSYSCSVSHAKMLWVLYVEGNEYPIAVGGKGCMYFFRRSGKGAERCKGTVGKRKKLQPILCGVEGAATEHGFGQTTIITGTVTGHLYVWLDRKVIGTVSAHESPIYAITKLSLGYATGGKDGLIKIWNADMQPQHTYNTALFSPQPMNFCVHAVKANFSNSRLLVGMRSGEVYEVSLPTHSTAQLLDTHSHKQLHGLDVSPTNPDEFVTVGDDGVVRLWSISKCCSINKLNIDVAARAVGYFPDGDKIVVGIGGDPTSATKEGAFLILRVPSLELVLEDRKAKQYISDVKFSPDGRVFVMTSYDGKIYVHDTLTYVLIRGIELPSKTKGLKRIDFSTDGMFMRVSSERDELYHYRVADGEIVTSPPLMRDVIWKTSTCPYTWMTQGCVRPAVEGVPILEVARSPDGNLLAVSYLNGQVRLYRYPCQTPNNGYHLLSGIATHATRLKFSEDGEYLLALDAFTRSVLQYKIGKFRPELAV